MATWRRPTLRGAHGAGLSLCLLLSLVIVTAAAADWTLRQEAGPLRVESRPYDRSPLQELRGVTTVQASLGALMALLRDADYNEHWVYRSGGAKIIATNGYRQAHVYGVVDAPWPMRDRDSIVRFDYRQDRQTRVITIDIQNVPDYLPERAGLVRVPELGGFWELRPLDNGQVRVTYQVHGDPGGRVPVWLANLAARLSVIHTLENLPAAVARYAGATSSYVAEADDPSSYPR